MHQFVAKKVHTFILGDKATLISFSCPSLRKRVILYFGGCYRPSFFIQNCVDTCLTSAFLSLKIAIFSWGKWYKCRSFCNIKKTSFIFLIVKPWCREGCKDLPTVNSKMLLLHGHVYRSQALPCAFSCRALRRRKAAVALTIVKEVAVGQQSNCT